MSKSIILATTNPHKVDKLSWIVKGFLNPIEMPEKIDVEEDGKTFEENAQIKARAIAKKFGEYAIASDGGALIPSLGYQWNALLTRRFIGSKTASDWDRIDGLLSLMKDKIGSERKVVWREAIAVANKNGDIVFSKEVEGDTGIIQTKYNKDQYREGIWLCTLTSYPQFEGKNFFELTKKEQKKGEMSWWRLKDETQAFLETIS